MKRLWYLLKQHGPVSLRPFLQEAALRFFYHPELEGAGDDLRFTKPVVVFSTDFELAWAWRYSGRPLDFALTKARQERAQVPRLLRLLEDCRVPITWATVGHLALRACRRDRGRAHSASPSLAPYRNPHWSFSSQDWYEFDPCTSSAESPEWYAPDLIEQILKAPIGHEIGCHSFSHSDSTEAHCPADFFRAELQQSAEAFATFGLSPRSFVFPGNLPGHHAILREFGYDIVRDYPWHPGVVFAPAREIVKGLWGLHQSMYLESPGYESSYLLRKTRRLVQVASSRPRILSLWFHPSLSDEDFSNVFAPVVKICANKRDRGEIEILTMGELAKRLNAAPRLGL